MRTEENCVILEGGDNLFRYNLGRELPTEWSIYINRIWKEK